jgi:hypothetical protein
VESRLLSDLTERLNVERRVWVRVVAIRPDTDWQLALLEVTLGEAPPSWRRCRWRYPRAVFIASALSGRTVATWLTRERLALRPPSVAIRTRGSLHVERHDSRFAGLLEALPWPSIDWTTSVEDAPTQALQGSLVATDAPAFLGYDYAVAGFLGVQYSSNRSFSWQIVVREQDRRARIDHVRVRPTEVVVGVSGDALDGTSVTLGGEAAPAESLSTASREVRLPLASSLSEGAWIALHRGHELLDRRVLDPSWRDPEIEVELDEQTRVEILVSRGEGESTEFKRQLPDANPRGVMKTVAAFANGGGGSLLFGVDDDGEVVGLGADVSQEAVDRLTSLIDAWVRPRVTFSSALVDVRGARVLLVDVAGGADPPYGVGTKDQDVVYYMRRGATTFPAGPLDIRTFVLSRIESTSALPYRWLRR